MLHFEWPWALLLAPTPLLARFLPPVAETGAALRIPFAKDFQVATTTAGKPIAYRRQLLILLAWCAFLLALARPQWLGEHSNVTTTGRDLMLAVDLSRSMATRDMARPGGLPINRLQATQQVASDFIEGREGDRIGLVFFGTQAYLQSPLSFDRNTVRTLLSETGIGLLGDKTAIGDGIGLALRHLLDNDAPQRVLILLTDGANTAGATDPRQMAELAAAKELRIYTIGIGAPGLGWFGNSGGTELDEQLLREIAQRTGARYFRGRNTRELKEIHQELDRLEKLEQKQQGLRPYIDLFHWPLTLACLLAALLLVAPRAGGWRRRAVSDRDDSVSSHVAG